MASRHGMGTERRILVPIDQERKPRTAGRAVYIGPFNTNADALPQVEVLKEKELDYFLYHSEEGEVRVSLDISLRKSWLTNM